MKRCLGCGCLKPSTDFYRHAGNADGLQKRCKRCHIESNRLSRLANPEASIERARLYRERHAESERARKAAWTLANREKRRAHHLVEQALLAGRLVRPTRCEQCSRANLKIHAHHEDYSAPLDVQWLCSSCHGLRHVKGAAA